MPKKIPVFVVVILSVLLISSLSFIIIQKNKYDGLITNLNKKIFEFQETIKTQAQKISDLEAIKTSLEEMLGLTQEELKEGEEKIDDLKDDVTKLKKIINTDKELLKLYSKVSFLNEHYIPEKLTEINSEFVFGEKKLEIHSRISEHLQDMLDDARNDGIDLKVLPAYRSFGEQASLKYNYLIRYGSGANTFSADQGYSEHQLGTTVDLTTSSIGNGLSVSFDQTKEFEWLKNNAYRYGFVLSYAKGNIYYQYEPWHWRFVSRDLARYLHRNEKSFYEMEQRDTDKYLEDFFD